MNGTTQFRAVENDAAGGAGSIKDTLLALTINGISRAVDGRLARRYPLASGNETITYDANGRPVPSGAPTPPLSAGAQVANAFSNPIVIAVGAAVVLAVIIAVAIRK